MHINYIKKHHYIIFKLGVQSKPKPDTPTCIHTLLYVSQLGDKKKKMFPLSKKKKRVYIGV